jgi:hypothetical protein
MRWTSVTRRFSKFTSKKQTEQIDSKSLSIETSQSTLVVEYPVLNLPVIPPELWLQIVNFIPLEDLWFIRGTCRLFNTLALVRVWEMIRDSEVGVQTFFDSEHEPLSYTGIPEIYSPVVPKSLMIDPRLRRTAIDDPAITAVKKATWRVTEEQGRDCEDLRFSYRPVSLEIRFASSIKAGYKLEQPIRKCGLFNELIRVETWSNLNNSIVKPGKFMKRFSKRADRTQSPWPVYKGPQPEWNVIYMAEYELGRNDEGMWQHQLKELTHREVSLPIPQIVGAFIDALKYNHLIVEEET